MIMTTCIGKVIRIVDEFTLIINAGSLSLSVGDKVQVYESGEPIVDLDGTALDEYIYVKDELEVVQVEERYSVCKKNKTVSKRIFSPFALSPLLEQTTTENVPMNIEESELKPLPSIDETIHVGDKVKRACR